MLNVEAHYLIMPEEPQSPPSYGGPHSMLQTLTYTRAHTKRPAFCLSPCPRDHVSPALFPNKGFGSQSSGPSGRHSQQT